MASIAEKEYDAFQERVRRTIYIDNLSPQVNESVLKKGLGQYVTVKDVRFIPNYSEPKNAARCALVEVETSEQAQEIIKDVIDAYPFMILGIPRPVRARPAEEEMFDDRPAKPGRRIELQWLHPNDPDFQVAWKLKRLVKKHAAEASFMMKQQLEAEEKLAKQQEEMLKVNKEKLMLIDGVMDDKSAFRLASYYNVNDAEI